MYNYFLNRYILILYLYYFPSCVMLLTIIVKKKKLRMQHTILAVVYTDSASFIKDSIFTKHKNLINTRNRYAAACSRCIYVTFFIALSLSLHYSCLNSHEVTFHIIIRSVHRVMFVQKSQPTADPERTMSPRHDLHVARPIG